MSLSMPWASLNSEAPSRSLSSLSQGTQVFCQEFGAVEYWINMISSLELWPMFNLHPRYEPYSTAIKYAVIFGIF